MNDQQSRLDAAYDAIGGLPTTPAPTPVPTPELHQTHYIRFAWTTMVGGQVHLIEAQGTGYAQLIWDSLYEAGFHMVTKKPEFNPITGV